MKDREPGPNSHSPDVENQAEAIKEKWALMEGLASIPATLSSKAEENWYRSRIIMIGGAWLVFFGGISLAHHYWGSGVVSAPSVVRAAVSLPAQAPRQESSLVVLPESVHEVEKYIEDFRKLDRRGNSLENTRREWKVFYASQFANLTVSTDQGIWVHDFPNKDSSRSIPTGGPGTGPTWKAWYWGHPIPGQYNVFVAEFNKQTWSMAVWAARSTSEGGWGPSPYLPVHKQPHLEFWRVYASDDPERWFVNFEVNGKQVSGEQFLTHTLPQPLFAPNQQKYLGDGSADYGNGVIGPSLADQSRSK